MSDPSDKSMGNGDGEAGSDGSCVAWVKLGKVWWPGKILSEGEMTDEMRSELSQIKAKKTKGSEHAKVVQYFNEDDYIITKNPNEIIREPDQDKKWDLIKRAIAQMKGSSLAENLPKFKADVLQSERLLDPSMDLTEITRLLDGDSLEAKTPTGVSKYADIFPTMKLEKPSVSTPPIGTSVGRSGKGSVKFNFPSSRIISTASSKPLSKQSPLPNDPKKKFHCVFCGFSSDRCNVIPSHMKYCSKKGSPAAKSPSTATAPSVESPQKSKVVPKAVPTLVTKTTDSSSAVSTEATPTSSKRPPGRPSRTSKLGTTPASTPSPLPKASPVKLLTSPTKTPVTGSSKKRSRRSKKEKVMSDKQKVEILNDWKDSSSEAENDSDDELDMPPSKPPELLLFGSEKNKKRKVDSSVIVGVEKEGAAKGNDEGESVVAGTSVSLGIETGKPDEDQPPVLKKPRTDKELSDAFEALLKTTKPEYGNLLDKDASDKQEDDKMEVDDQDDDNHHMSDIEEDALIVMKKVDDEDLKKANDERQTEDLEGKQDSPSKKGENQKTTKNEEHVESINKTEAVEVETTKKADEQPRRESRRSTRRGMASAASPVEQPLPPPPPVVTKPPPSLPKTRSSSSRAAREKIVSPPPSVAEKKVEAQPDHGKVNDKKSVDKQVEEEIEAKKVVQNDDKHHTNDVKQDALIAKKLKDDDSLKKADDERPTQHMEEKEDATSKKTESQEIVKDQKPLETMTVTNAVEPETKKKADEPPRRESRRSTRRGMVTNSTPSEKPAQQPLPPPPPVVTKPPPSLPKSRSSSSPTKRAAQERLGSPPPSVAEKKVDTKHENGALIDKKSTEEQVEEKIEVNKVDQNDDHHHKNDIEQDALIATKKMDDENSKKADNERPTQHLEEKEDTASKEGENQKTAKNEKSTEAVKPTESPEAETKKKPDEQPRRESRRSARRGVEAATSPTKSAPVEKPVLQPLPPPPPVVTKPPPSPSKRRSSSSPTKRGAQNKLVTPLPVIAEKKVETQNKLPPPPPVVSSPVPPPPPVVTSPVPPPPPVVTSLVPPPPPVVSSPIPPPPPVLSSPVHSPKPSVPQKKPTAAVRPLVDTKESPKEISHQPPVVKDTKGPGTRVSAAATKSTGSTVSLPLLEKEPTPQSQQPPSLVQSQSTQQQQQSLEVGAETSDDKKSPALVAQRVVHLVPVENADGSITYMLLSLENGADNPAVLLEQGADQAGSVLRLDKVEPVEGSQGSVVNLPMNPNEVEGIFLDKNVDNANQIVSALAAAAASTTGTVTASTDANSVTTASAIQQQSTIIIPSTDGNAEDASTLQQDGIIDAAAGQQVIYMTEDGALLDPQSLGLTLEQLQQLLMNQ